MRSVRLVISGKVQDVGYRSFVKRNAEMLKISGHVRNLPTGEVELICSGPEEAIKEMIKHFQVEIKPKNVQNKEYFK